MARKQVGLKTRNSNGVKRTTAEKKRQNAEAKRFVAEEGRERAETGRRKAADRVRDEEDQRKVMEELRITAEDMRKSAEKFRQASMVNIESQERMRETAEFIRVGEMRKFIEEARWGINDLRQEAATRLEEMEEISKSAKEIFHTLQEMLQKASKQMEKPRS